MHKPILGSKLWYYPSKNDISQANKPMTVDSAGAADATVVGLHYGGPLMNLHVVDMNGAIHQRFGVQLVEFGGALPQGGGYAVWPPHVIQRHVAAVKALADADIDKVLPLTVNALGGEIGGFRIAGAAPPLGVTPQKLWLEARFREVARALHEVIKDSGYPEDEEGRQRLAGYIGELDDLREGLRD